MPRQIVAECREAEIKVSRKVKDLDPVVKSIAKNLADLAPIRLVRILPDFLQASSEVTAGRFKLPVTKTGHASAIGVSLILNFECQEVQFFEITSAVKGYGGKMVEAVMSALPQEWRAIVLMDWSDGFWERMQAKYENLEIT